MHINNNNWQIGCKSETQDKCQNKNSDLGSYKHDCSSVIIPYQHGFMQKLLWLIFSFFFYENHINSRSNNIIPWHIISVFYFGWYFSIFIYLHLYFQPSYKPDCLIIILMSMTLRNEELDKNNRTISTDGVTRNKSAPRLLPHYCHQLSYRVLWNFAPLSVKWCWLLVTTDWFRIMWPIRWDTRLWRSIAPTQPGHMLYGLLLFDCNG